MQKYLLHWDYNYTRSKAVIQDHGILELKFLYFLNGA